MPFVFIKENDDCGANSRQKIDRLKRPINFVKNGADIYIIKMNDVCDLVKEITSNLIERPEKNTLLVVWTSKSSKKKQFSLQERLVAEIKDVFNRRGADGIDELYQESIQTLENPKLNLVITGDSGTGKSSFINAFRKKVAIE